MKVKVITQLEEHISNELDKICNNKEIKKEDKLEAYNVYYNIFKFLKDYDNNIEILQKQIEKEKYEGR